VEGTNTPSKLKADATYKLKQFNQGLEGGHLWVIEPYVGVGKEETGQNLRVASGPLVQISLSGRKNNCAKSKCGQSDKREGKEAEKAGDLSKKILGDRSHGGGEKSVCSNQFGVENKRGDGVVVGRQNLHGTKEVS